MGEKYYVMEVWHSYDGGGMTYEVFDTYDKLINYLTNKYKNNIETFINKIEGDELIIIKGKKRNVRIKEKEVIKEIEIR